MAICFEDIGFEHFIEEVGVFGVKICGFDGVEDGGFWVNFLIFDKLFALNFYPIGVEDEEALFDWSYCHNYYETNFKSYKFQYSHKD